MSIRAYRWAKQQTMLNEHDKLTAAEKFVLVMIGDHYNDVWHRAWPSRTTLAEETGLSVPTVKRSIRSLATAGLLLIEPWVLNEGAGALSNRYLLPKFNPAVTRASHLPVLAFAWPDSPGAEMDNCVQVPGSNLYIEEADLY